MLLEQLKKDSLNARKEKNTIKSNLLTTLISEAVMIGKNDGNREPTEEEITAVIKKFIKSNKEATAALQKSGRDDSKEIEEEKILTSYLPKQLSESELESIIQEIISKLSEKSPKMMGQVMSELKNNYAGLFDGQTASQIVKKNLIE
ncbi:MAG: GatB/YqeY domain-containing protein [Spirochaetia bacterium]|nr:GatB/YqeY domain-containing protein [Spirochaetia bacterium]